MKKKNRDYSMIRSDDLPKVREPGERIRIKSQIVINRDVFRKTDEEKQRLKTEKSRLKYGFTKKPRFRLCRAVRRENWIRLHPGETPDGYKAPVIEK